METWTFPLAIPAFLELHVTTTRACVSVRDQDILPTDNPPSTYLRRAPLTRRTPWHDRCSVGGVGIRDGPAEGTRDSTSVAEVAATVVMAAAVNDEKKRATTFLSRVPIHLPENYATAIDATVSTTFFESLRNRSIALPETIFVDRRRAFAEYRITRPCVIVSIKLSLISSITSPGYRAEKLIPRRIQIHVELLQSLHVFR